jgi:hypothetical protein
MKLLLLIGATLMTGAGIYGFVDYKKKEQIKAFKALYKEEKPVVQQPTPEIVTSPAPIMVFKNNDAPGKKSKKGKHKKVRYTQFSRAAIEEMEIEEPAPPVKEMQ